MLARPDDLRVAPDLTHQACESWPCFEQDAIDAVVAVLESGRVNQWSGDKVRSFEQAYERLLGSGRAIALANGSVALELALRAFGIGPGDEVVVTPRSFIASVSCVRLVGATPVFADVDCESGNITADTIAAVLTPRTKAIIPVHLAGWPADMPAIMSLARPRGIKVIEDCAQAHGAEINGSPVGSFGDAAAFSFCHDKIISTGGEGGLLVLQSDDAYEFAWSYKDHGKTLAKVDQPQQYPTFRWLHESIGTNWRMLETSAAIGLVQLGRLETWRAVRQRNAGIWTDALKAVPGMRVPHPAMGLVHACYKFYAYLCPDIADVESVRDSIISRAAAIGVRLFSGSCPEIYLERAFSDQAVVPLPAARSLGATSLMFEVHPTLDPDRLRQRASAIAEIVADAIR